MSDHATAGDQAPSSEVRRGQLAGLTTNRPIAGALRSANTETNHAGDTTAKPVGDSLAVVLSLIHI